MCLVWRMSGAVDCHAQRAIQRLNWAHHVCWPSTPTAETCVSDASSGDRPQPQQTNGMWSPIMLISSGLSEMEKYYAQTEKEALAVTWVHKWLTPYLLGLKAELHTDHKPFMSLLSTIDELPLCWGSGWGWWSSRSTLWMCLCLWMQSSKASPPQARFKVIQEKKSSFSEAEEVPLPTAWD